MNGDKLRSLDPRLHAEIRQLIDVGDATAAIKRLHEATACGLAAAKEWVDRELMSSSFFVASVQAPPVEEVPLSEETRRRVEILFDGDDRELAEGLLVDECGNNLPLLKNLSPQKLERYRFAALKLSEGRLDKLRAAVAMAKHDWRDLLVAAGFAHDVQAHERWLPEKPVV